jgi:hypothetical protein
LAAATERIAASLEKAQSAKPALDPKLARESSVSYTDEAADARAELIRAAKGVTDKEWREKMEEAEEPEEPIRWR